MITSWSSSIKDTGKLTVYNGIAVGKWATVFKAALASFNKNSGLTIKMVETKNKDQANIVMQLSGGTSSFEYDGTTYPVVFDGTLAHGQTLTFARDGGIEKAAVFLPITPKENHIDVLRFIAVHELIHACGLENGEHAGDGVFITLPNIRNGKIWASADSKKMPPLFFSQSTISKLQNNLQ